MSIEIKRHAIRRGDATDGVERVRRVLFVAYTFPPVGGVSVQRVTKFVKYLPEFGWASSVLTVANPSVPMFDETLLSQIPAGTQIRRARTLEPGYALKSVVAKSDVDGTSGVAGLVASRAKDVARRAFNLMMQPDAQILWRPHALREGLKLLRELPHDAIVATGPPFSSMLLGLTLSKTTGVPLVLDYRDEWAFMTYWENKQIGGFDRFIQGNMQRRVLRQARLVLGTTQATAKELKSLMDGVHGHGKVDYIYNGFDPADYPADKVAAVRADYGFGTGLFRMSFAGTLWNATPIGPVVDGILALSRRAPELAAQLELVIAGRRTGPQEAELDRLAATSIKLVRLPFIAHKDAIGLMCSSDALLLINADLPHTDRLINAKTFEYMGARRPIFVVAPKGELWQVAGAIPGALLARPGDSDAIASNLEAAVRRWQQGGDHATVAEWNISQFERRNLTGRLAGLLDEIAAVDRRH